MLSAILINIASMILILLFILRRAGDVAFRWTAILLSTYFLFQSRSFISPWNPDVTILPLAAFGVVAAAATFGSFSAILLALFIGSFLVQTHIGYLLSVVLVLMAVLACRFVLITRAKTSRDGKTLLKRSALAMLFLLLLWMPTIWQQRRQKPGNLTEIYNFFSSKTSNHNIGEVFLGVSSSMLPPFVPQNEFSIGLLIPIAQTLFLVFVLAISFRKNRRFNAALSLLALVMEVAAIFSVKHVIGDLRPYLLLWISAIALMMWIPIGAALLYQLPRSNRNGRPMKIVKLLSYLILIVFTFVNSWNMLHAKLVRHDDPRVRPLTDTILTHLAQEGKKKPLLLIADYHKWGIASGVMLQLRKANQGFAIQGWHPILQHEPTGNEDEYLWFTGRYFHEQLKHDPRYKQIAREENCFVYEAPLSLMKDSQTVWKMIEEEDRQTSGFRTKQKEGT